MKPYIVGVIHMQDHVRLVCEQCPGKGSNTFSAQYQHIWVCQGSYSIGYKHFQDFPGPQKHFTRNLSYASDVEI